MKLRVLVLAATTMLLAGCFDGHYDVGLNSDGSGRIAIDIVLDKDLSRDILKDNKGKLKMDTQHSSLGKNARSSQRVENGSIVVSEVLDFRSLSDITGGDVDIEVTRLGRTMFGATRSQVRFATSAERGRKETSDQLGAQLINQMFKGHEARITLHLPCSVESANAIVSDGITYTPKIDKSWFSGSTVEWRLPMAAALSPQRVPHDFTATCWSYVALPPGKSRTR